MERKDRASSEDAYLKALQRKANRIQARTPRAEKLPIEEIPLAKAEEGAEITAPVAPANETAKLEAIIRWYRPVLVVTDDRFVRPDGGVAGDPRFSDPNQQASKLLLERLETNRAVLDPVIRSVGRIELKNNVRYPWAGTGWIIASDLGDDIVVTNQHVAREFARRSGNGFVFRPGVPDASTVQVARIDFREELGGARSREFPITDVIWISDDPNADVALLRVARSAGDDRIDPPIRLFDGAVGDQRMLAVIGYPGSGDGYDPEPFRMLFGPTLGVKRFSPGYFDGDRGASITYDCSTLPGSSGSVVVDVDSGSAIGLHFAGTAFDTNYAVPAAKLASILRSRPWHPERGPAQVVLLADTDTASPGGTATEATTTILVPIEITVKVGEPGGAARAAISAAPSAKRTAGSESTAVARVREHLRDRAEVFDVAIDRLFEEGALTERTGVIVKVAPGSTLDPAAYGLGTSVDGVPISIETADPETVIEEQGFVREAFGGRRARYSRDLKKPEFDLKPVSDDMEILLHASPEAGWSVLKGFLETRDVDQLTIGMYHMTAPHVMEALTKAIRRPGTAATVTLDRQRGEADPPDDISPGTKANDIPESDSLAELEQVAGQRIRWAPASLGASGLFASAYHIKAAVWSKRGAGGALRDHSFWLSSGNWQSSNQPPFDIAPKDVKWSQAKEYNREWHAVVRHAGLAKTLRRHLEQDYEDNRDAAEDELPPTAPFDVLVPQGERELARKPERFRAFAPLSLKGATKVQLLLTPDNYPEVIARLVADARERVLIENQSFAFWKDVDAMPEHFMKILEAVKERQEAGLDVRVIFRSGFGKERETLRAMRTFGLRAGPDDVRFFDKCHTKGIVIDDEIAILGSQNWTAAGTGPNRDASLVIWDARANRYFAQLFEYDWEEVAERKVRAGGGGEESVRFVPAGLEAPTPRGFRRISLAEYLGET